MEGPHQAEIKCRDLGNGKCEVIYYPTKPGEYTVHVTCNGKDIPKSPFTVPITPGGDASKCYAEGPGLEPDGLVAGKYDLRDFVELNNAIYSFLPLRRFTAIFIYLKKTLFNVACHNNL